ncbi:MAG: penicillin-binding protein [Oscillospiraceae bacterium]|nr:penicillin-binding protein [Oscillospiraceae bacterium]
MRKTDINQYAGSGKVSGDRISTGRSAVRMILKGLLTVFVILAITGGIVLISLAAFVYNLKDSSVDLDLQKLKLNYTTFIYVNGSNDDSSKPVQYKSLYSDENRIWEDYDKIPQSMKDAVVAIEDKRFWEHNGVDWKRTFGAAANLFNLFQSQSSSYGGSTITQQLIKNLTGEDEVSLTRKVKEIFRAMNLEKKYSKEEILTAYLNVVSFGNGCNGVEAAANLYFEKDIKDCDIAQCAAIAGITQNPTAYNPFTHPEANRKRQQTVLAEMLSQGKITKGEYQSAMAESETMKFAGKKKANVVDENSVWDWYTDALFEDVKQGLMKAYNCSDARAVDILYHGGLKIYSAVNTSLQNISEKAFTDRTTFPASYPNLQGGYVAMDYSGRVMAIVGSRGKKTQNRLYNLATDAKRQPGSSIKPLAVYAPAVNIGKVNYSSLLDDAPVPNWKNGKPGPGNWDHQYHGKVTVEYALEQSWNAAAVQLFKSITPAFSMNFMQQKLGFTSLVPDDRNHLSVAIGGLTYGVTVREMTAGFQMFGNGGKYYQPYTYYYVTDHDGNVIPGMDNRSEVPTQAISSSAATIMNKLLNNVMKNGTGKQADISGWQTFGKTGTTDDNKDSWFVGGTPYAVAGVWTGYTSPQKVGDYQASFAKKIWKTIMSQYLADKPDKTFHFDPNVISAVFRKDTGLLAVPGAGVDTGVGWYDKNNLPAADSSLAASSSVPAESSSPSPESSSRPEGLWPGTSSDASQADSSSETTTSTVSESSSSAASSHSKAGDQKGNDVHGKSAGLT